MARRRYKRQPQTMKPLMIRATNEEDEGLDVIFICTKFIPVEGSPNEKAAIIMIEAFVTNQKSEVPENFTLYPTWYKVIAILLIFYIGCNLYSNLF